MKHIFAFLLLFVPMISWANDTCTNPRDYTLDRRCYVTHNERMDFPYNTIVRIGNVATGTIIGPNLILTCRSCVNPEKYNTPHGDIEFYTSDNQRHIAREFFIPTEQAPDSEWALLKTKDTFKTPFLEISNSADASDLGQIGFSALKILNDKELQIVKLEYDKIMKKYDGKKITSENVSKFMAELDGRLEKRKCRSDKDKSCMKCDSGPTCIFNDFANMKKEADCIIVSADRTYKSSTCTAGDMGAPMVGNNNQKLKGVSFSKNIFFTSFARYNAFALPRYYYETVMKYVNNPLYIKHAGEEW